LLNGAESGAAAATTPQGVQAHGTKGHPKHAIGLFAFLAITSSMVMTIYNYPVFGTTGFALVFFLLAAGLLWFVPAALVAAEMATGERGWSDAGVFSWGTAAFGKRWGFVMIYLQFMQITIGMIAMLYFVTAAFSTLFSPAFNENALLKFATVFSVFWLVTIANFWGTKVVARIATWGFTIGILLPAVLVIALGIIFVMGDNTIAIVMDAQTFFPDFARTATLVVFVSFILSFMGIEGSATHVNDLRNPGRNYPLAVFILVVGAILLNCLGGLTVAVAIPEKDINLSAGLYDTIGTLLDVYSIHWLVYPAAVCIALGAIAEISSWVSSPSRGLRFSASQGLLPPSFARRNKHGVSIRILIIQGIIVTAWMLLLTFGTSGGQTTQKGSGAGNVAFFTTEALTVLTYLSMYVLLFLSYLKLKVKHPDNPRKFNMPAWLGWAISILGLASTLFAYVIGWFRPDQIPESSYTAYLMILAGGFVVIFAIPHIIYHFARDAWGEQARSLMAEDDFAKSLAAHGVEDEEMNQANRAAAHGGV